MTLLWVPFALGAALAAALMPLVQERLQVNGMALAVWVKIITVLLTAPLALAAGLPTNPLVYGLIFITAIIYSISDVVYFRAAACVGAGPLTRLIPTSVIGVFLLWFVIDPGLLQKYLATPVISLCIFAVVCIAAGFAMQLKKCAVSWAAVKIIWPILVAATIGPVLSKYILNLLPPDQAVFPYIFIQALMMLCCWGLYGLWRRPFPLPQLVTKPVMKAGLIVGACSASMVILKMQAVAHSDQPAFPIILLYTDTLWVLLIYKMLGRTDNSNVLAGLGIVASAALLVLFKSQIQ